MRGEDEHFDLAQIIHSGRVAAPEAEEENDGAPEPPLQQLARHRMLADALVHLGQAFHLPDRVLRLLASAAAGDRLEQDQIEAISICSPRPSPLVQELTQTVARTLDPQAFVDAGVGPVMEKRRRAALAKARSVLVILGLATEPSGSGPEDDASA